MTTPRARRPPAALAAVLLVLALAGCGGDDGDGGADGGDGVDAAAAPGDAEAADFCGLVRADSVETVDQARDLATRLAEIGTPSQVSGEAREGYEAFVRFLAEIDDETIQRLRDSAEAEEQPDQADEAIARYTEVFGEDGEKVLTFLLQAGTVCAGTTGDGGDDVGTDVPGS